MEPSTAAADLQAEQNASRERFEREYKAQQLKLRLQGVAMTAIGLLLNAVNVFTILAMDRYFLLTLALGPAMLFVGICLAAVGRPIDRATGRPATWGNAALVASVALGALVTIAGFVLLNSE